MKKIALSLFVIAASGAYVWNQAGQKSADDLLGPALPPTPQTQGMPERDTTGSIVAPTAIAWRPLRLATIPPIAAPVEVPAPPPPSATAPPALRISDVPIPRLRPSHPQIPAKVTRAAMTVTANGSYADGTYTGPVTDAYYGPMRIQAIVQGGRLVAIKVLEYPSDRRTSVAINRQALPMLRDEVIAAQSARVDIVSGATLTSRAFIESLDAALGQAAGTSL
jgi:uncharacterized protein with FMN-binding domain